MLSYFLTALGLFAFWKSSSSSSISGGATKSNSTNNTRRSFYKRLAYSTAFLVAYLYNCIYFFIDSITGNGFDESVFYHLEHGMEGAGVGQFRGLIAAAVGAVIFGAMLTAAIFWCDGRPRQQRPQQRQGDASQLQLQNQNQLLPLRSQKRRGISDVPKKRRDIATQQPQQRQHRPSLLSASQLEALGLMAMLFSVVSHPLSSDLRQHYALSSASASASSDPNRSSSSSSSFSFRQSYHDPKQTIQNFHPTKNILYIYMESLERAYLDPTVFPNLAPNLQRWEKHERATTFTNIAKFPGTGFTIAGMVAGLCGIPLASANGASDNSMGGAKEFLPGATCLSDMLSDAGYTQEFVGGADLNFAGKRSFLENHGFDALSGRTELLGEKGGDHPNAMHGGEWGLYDDELLEIVFDRYKELSSVAAGTGTPFGLYALTLDTHDVHPSPACAENNILVGDGSILDSVRCTDYLLDRFLHRVLDYDSNNGNSNGTLIVLASDHLAMGYSKIESYLHGSNVERTNSFIVLDTEDQYHSTGPASYNTPGTAMDIPATLLSFLGHPKTPFGLGRDLTSGETLTSLIPGFGIEGSGLSREMVGGIREFWQMPDLGKDPVTEVDVGAKETTP